jgi:hypothetical protein
MKPEISNDYNLFLRFIEKFSPKGFTCIDRNDSLILELEEMMERNNQFFYIGDVNQMKIIFTSKRSVDMLGIEPDELTPYHFFEATHPDDIHRHSLGRSKLFRMTEELYSAQKGHILFSTNFRFRNPQGGYSNILYQLYLYYSEIPYKSVFLLKIHTNIDWFKKIKKGFHYNIDNSLVNFKYPDEKLLLMGNVFSDREFEIIKLIESGLGSEQIAEKIFISPNTVNTHRRNILNKTNKSLISDLIYDLKERGIL